LVRQIAHPPNQPSAIYMLDFSNNCFCMQEWIVQ
jgi:hypothetical protein